MRVKYYHDMAAWADARTQAGRRESADKGSHDLADAAGPTCMAEPTRPGRRGPRCPGRRSLADAGRCRQTRAGADRGPKRADGCRRGRADAAGPTRADAGGPTRAGRRGRADAAGPTRAGRRGRADAGRRRPTRADAGRRGPTRAEPMHAADSHKNTIFQKSKKNKGKSRKINVLTDLGPPRSTSWPKVAQRSLVKPRGLAGRPRKKTKIAPDGASRKNPQI